MYRRLAALFYVFGSTGFALLDRLDGDADLEDGGDAEPSLACPEGREYQVVWCVGCDDDREIS